MGDPVCDSRRLLGAGGSVGLGTLSPEIQQAADEGDRTLFAALWITVALELFSAVLALALTKPWEQTFPDRLPLVGGRKVPGWLVLTLAWGAGTLLAGHGALFVSFGLSSGSGADAYWYIRFWGPWFLLGGLLFMTAGWAYMRNSSNRRIAVGASVLGGLGGLAAAAAPLVVSALASPA